MKIPTKREQTKDNHRSVTHRRGVHSTQGYSRYFQRLTFKYVSMIDIRLDTVGYLERERRRNSRNVTRRPVQYLVRTHALVANVHTHARAGRLSEAYCLLIRSFLSTLV